LFRRNWRRGVADTFCDGGVAATRIARPPGLPADDLRADKALNMAGGFDVLLCLVGATGAFGMALGVYFWRR
jgi:hypothetical protein